MGATALRTRVITRTTAAMVAEREGVIGELALLQRQQCDTVRELLRLRVEQLQLRIQQLSALSTLLDSERMLLLAAPQQLSTVQRVIDLLTASLTELLAEPPINDTDAMQCSHAAAVAQLSASMSAIDSRADEIATMARALLEVLHASPQRLRVQRVEAAGAAPAGASEEQIGTLPTSVCVEHQLPAGDRCPICLCVFQCGDTVRELQCKHYHHRACLDPWLRIKNCCSLCKAVAIEDPPVTAEVEPSAA